jgi:protein-disulfide isomerase
MLPHPIYRHASRSSVASILALCVLGALSALPQAFAADAIPPAAGDDVVTAHQQALQNDPNSPVIGNPQGDVTIVEFFDYDCSYCKAVQPRLEQALRADGHVKLILKEFPILTPESLIAARASLASMRQHKYRQFHEALMAYHGQWGEDAIFSTARSVGLDMARLRRDMASPTIDSELITNFNLARGLRIFQTPGFVVGNHILIGPSAQIDFPAVISAARAQRS